MSVALGVIAYVIGGAISPSQLRRLGWTIVGATLGEVSGAFLMVAGAVLLLGMTVVDLPLWSFAVVHQYRARGPVHELMDQRFVSARLDEHVHDVLHKNMERWVDDIPVLDGDSRLAGIIRLVDLVRAAIEPSDQSFG